MASDELVPDSSANLETLSAEVASLREEVARLREEVELLKSSRPALPQIVSICDAIPISQHREELLKALSYSTQLTGDCHLFRAVYLAECSEPPVKRVSKNRVDYWLEGVWIESTRSEVGKILAITFANAYSGVNRMDVVGREAMMTNLNRIVSLREKTSYHKELIEAVLAMRG